MKRSISNSVDPITGNATKKIKLSEQPPSPATEVLFDENLLFEILKHVDERTLGLSSCVCKQWHRTAQDERLWELICTKRCTNMAACGSNKLRSVVLALGGFRRLHAHYLWPLSKSKSSKASTAISAAVSSSPWPCLPPPRTVGLSNPTSPKTRWGKDEVQLSLSLLSIRYYEKISFRNQTK